MAAHENDRGPVKTQLYVGVEGRDGPGPMQPTAHLICAASWPQELIALGVNKCGMGPTLCGREGPALIARTHRAGQVGRTALLPAPFDFEA